MTNKHVILRKDVATNKMLPSNELIRIVKNKDGEVFIDQSKKANGRGVYISPNMDALNKAKEHRLLDKALKTKVNDQVFLDLEKEIKENWD